jgi:hypothetical protein
MSGVSIELDRFIKISIKKIRKEILIQWNRMSVGIRVAIWQ